MKQVVTRNEAINGPLAIHVVVRGGGFFCIEMVFKGKYLLINKSYLLKFVGRSNV